mgnify:CR=1 FL=1
MSVRKHMTIAAMSLLALTGCVSTDELLQRPAVDLTSVEMGDMSFARQTFLLGFSVYNPNPFPLPVEGVEYRVRLNNEHFAGGETRGVFTIPANGDGSFVISVDLDLLRSSAQMTSILRAGLEDTLDYDPGLDRHVSPQAPGPGNRGAQVFRYAGRDRGFQFGPQVVQEDGHR